ATTSLSPRRTGHVTTPQRARLSGAQSIQSPLFFIQSSADPRTLHSFPTRRSSDLDGLEATRRIGEGRTPTRVLILTTFGVLPSRSEEHTSELQSQSNLVCRLLLEKKKTRRLSSISALTDSPQTATTFSLLSA